MKLLIVDDSIVARSLLKKALSGLETGVEIDSASNGNIALQKMRASSYDLVILDIEMPELDGLQTLEKMREEGLNMKTIVFASETPGAAQKTIKAFGLGAWDVIPKPVSDNFTETDLVERVSKAILPKVKRLLGAEMGAKKGNSTQKIEAKNQSLYPDVNFPLFSPSILVIASSTGGPAALEKVLTYIAGNSKIPILIAQHMPPFFTKSLAQNLGAISGLPAAEAQHGESLQPGKIYVAPGDFHMEVKETPFGAIVALDQRPQRNSVRPAADFLLESAAKIYGARTLALVLTGMGEDGKDGARVVKEKGGVVLIQNRETSIVWGMPGAVHDIGAFDKMGNLDELGTWVQGKCIGI